MTTLKQIFDKLYDNDNKICTRKSLFEQFKEVNREWLQQKHIEIRTIYTDGFVRELLKEL